MRLRLVTTSGHLIEIDRPHALVAWYQAAPGGVPNVKHGRTYYSDRATTTGVVNHIGFEDLSWATLLDGRPSADSAQTLLQRPAVNIGAIPAEPLHLLSTERDLPAMAAVIAGACGCDLGCQLVTKMLHPKRRQSVPVLDDKAIFGTFDHATWCPWEEPRAMASTVVSAQKILNGLTAVHQAVADPRNQREWRRLEAQYRPATRIEIFDQVWWALLHGGVEVRRTAGVRP